MQKKILEGRATHSDEWTNVLGGAMVQSNSEDIFAARPILFRTEHSGLFADSLSTYG